jgi:uncharacterized protein (TIGR02466 family)
MKVNYEILELFPTPVFTAMIPIEYSHVVSWLQSQEMLSEEVDSANYGERSKNSYILDEPELKDLKYFILQLVNEYGKLMGFDYESYRFSQSWISFKQPGQHHTIHSHPNSLISGVFYFGEPADETSAIKFHKFESGVNVPYLSPKIVKNVKDLKFSHKEFSIKFEPGLLLLFPSHLHHSVPLNKTEKTRCSVAFNVVPNVGFGDESMLTELKF